MTAAAARGLCALALSLAAACSTAGGLAVGAACGARYEACENQCRARFDQTNDTLAYADCLDVCKADEGKACR